MKVRVIINTLLIVLLIHLLLRNLTQSFNYPLERYENPLPVSDKSLDFLNINNDSYKELESYVNKCQEKSVKPGNYFTSDDNTPNFQSNVMNLNKFYDKNLSSYDGLKEEDLNTMGCVETPDMSNSVEKIGTQTCFPRKTGEDTTELFKPDNWMYKHELPMNGGAFMDNLVGYDSLNEGFASYGNVGHSLATCDPSAELNCNQEQDDIRFGLGKPNQEYRATR